MNWGIFFVRVFWRMRVASFYLVANPDYGEFMAVGVCLLHIKFDWHSTRKMHLFPLLYFHLSAVVSPRNSASDDATSQRTGTFVGWCAAL